jgi:hypothetical protein
MIKVRIVALTLLIGFNTFAQKFDVDIIENNGDLDKHINLVILSDGYTNNELSKFSLDATSFTNAFFNEMPFKNYRKYFNVFIIKVPSNESGASHPGTATDETEPVHPVIAVDNYFGSTFDYANIHRLLVATKTAAISSVLAANFPAYDNVLILVNSPYYGGSGGYYTVASTHTLSSEIALHELGHSFAGLKDEYWAGDAYAGEGINMTKITDPNIVRWKNWLGINLIGIYQHCCQGNSLLWYKPHQNCKMQYLGRYFCSVCIQAITERVHTLVTPVESYYPVDNYVTETFYPLKFKLSLIAPLPNTLRRNWLLNNLLFKQNIDSVLIYESSLLAGTNTLKVYIEDTTQLLRVDNHSNIHISLVTWSIDKNITDINEITSSSSEIIIDLYPNPASEFINIKLQGITKGKVKFEMYDMQGKRIKVSTLQSDIVNYVNLNNLDQGTYLIKIFIDNDFVTTKKIVKE